MPRYMLDTDICSYIIKRSNEAVISRLRTTPVADVCISVITKAELLYGVEVSPKSGVDETAVEAFLRHIAVHEFPEEAARHYASIRGHLKRRGTMIGANDLWIAAHARYLGLTLVTNNFEEFGRVPSLNLDNWTRTQLRRRCLRSRKEHVSERSKLHDAARQPLRCKCRRSSP